MSLNNVSQRNALAVRAIGTNYLNLYVVNYTKRC